jgi:hypothetical protein
MAGIGICYAPKSWETSLTFRYVYRGKSELPVWPYDLTPMNHSLRGNEYAGDFVLSHHLNEPTTIWMKISGLYIQENDYPATDYYFVGKRQKAALELGVKRSFGAHWETSLFVRGFTMHDAKRFCPVFMDERTYNGFSVGAAITARF